MSNTTQQSIDILRSWGRDIARMKGYRRRCPQCKMFRRPDQYHNGSQQCQSCETKRNQKYHR